MSGAVLLALALSLFSTPGYSVAENAAPKSAPHVATSTQEALQLATNQANIQPDPPGILSTVRLATTQGELTGTGGDGAW